MQLQKLKDTEKTFKDWMEGKGVVTREDLWRGEILGFVSEDEI
jgi:hypothetical protein